MANNTENHIALETNESSRETAEPSGAEHLERGENHKVWETNESTRCPFTGGAVSFTTSTRRSNNDWWPNALDLKILRQHSSLSDPMGENFNYAEEFKTLDLEAVKKDIVDLMTDSQEWWPAERPAVRRRAERRRRLEGSQPRSAPGRRGRSRTARSAMKTSAWRATITK